MTMQMVVDIGRRTLQATLLLAAPILVITMVVSLVINIVQVLTSVQDSTVSTVPRLAIAAGAAFLLMPWMMRQLAGFTLQMFSDFRPFLH
ncbi:MAG TPA: flagellar biosynthetic protein FliQ [Terriglobales bacterium]|nr:flagellar biosynthetic protein FliQ [Terriglobales bacterium]